VAETSPGKYANKTMVVFEIVGVLYPTFFGGESWQHFVQNELYVAETSPGKYASKAMVVFEIVGVVYTTFFGGESWRHFV